MIIIGITGTIGAGKGTVAEYLVSKGFLHYSVRDFLIKELNQRKLQISRDSMVTLANELRLKNSPSFIVDSLLSIALKNGKSAVIESIRTVGEIESLRKLSKNFFLLAVDAPVKVRYERITKRGASTDAVSFDKFLSDEKRESESINPWEQNLSKCIKMADATILNADFQNDLYKRVDLILSKIKTQKNL